MNVHALRPCLVFVATVIGRSTPFLVKGSSSPIAMRYQGCIRPHRALSASSRFANSGTGTAPFAFGEPYSAAEKTASAVTLRYCCSTRLTSSCFATYARRADLTSVRVYKALVLLKISERKVVGVGNKKAKMKIYSCPRSSKSGRVPRCGFHNSVTFILFPAFAAAAACCASRSSARRLRLSSSRTVWWSRWAITSAWVGYTATTTASGRASFSLSRPSFSAVRRKAESDLNVECLMSTGVVAVRVEARVGRICTVYRVVVGIEKADDDGRSTRVVRRACKNAARKRADTSGGAATS